VKIEYSASVRSALEKSFSSTPRAHVTPKMSLVAIKAKDHRLLQELLLEIPLSLVTCSSTTLCKLDKKSF
jgi:hypothetical protein